MKNNNSNVSRETLCARLNEHLLPAQLSFSVEQCERLCGFWAEVVRWNKTHNLTAITDFESAIDLHFVDSILPASEKNVFSGCNKVLDLGTGAGFPGIPLSVLFPNISFYLLDKNHKKISFLHYVTSLFNFSNAVPVNNSFFSLTDKYDAIISRAVKVDE